ncbi:uncharacterized protein [Diadema setosum]|uniref:uncharacterized protein isoform X2 n=1 Tax=Diadema setosum TaxID=31175 RepID=UPI003B3AC9D7
MAVATRMEPDKLAHLLGLRDQSNAPTNTGNKIEDNMKMLLKWRKMMCPPECNHRTTLADIMHNAGYKQVAMEIITGEYRDNAPNREALKELVDNTFGWRVGHLCQLLDVKLDETTAENVQIDLVEVLLQCLAMRKAKSRELSDKLHKAGYDNDLANEFMTDDYRDRVTNREVLADLACQIFGNKADRLCEALNVELQKKEGEGVQQYELLVRWVEQGKTVSRKMSDELVKAGFSDLPDEFVTEALDVKLEKRDGQGVQNDFLELLVRWVEKRKKDSSQISNKLYEAGFIDLSIEFLTGIEHGKVT